MATPPVNWNNVSMLTPGMKNLGNQFNARWPNRDGASDGAIGDYAHQQGDSGHNPDDTQYDNAEWDSDSDNKSEIRAIDVDSDLGESGTTMQMVIDHLRKLPNLGSVLRYMIYDRKIYKASNNFNPETYTGSSPHTEHAHFSGAYSDASDENKTFDFKFEEVGDFVDKNTFMAWMKEFHAKTNEGFATWSIDGIGGAQPAYQTLADTAGRTNIIKADTASLKASAADVATTLASIQAQLDEIKNAINDHVSGILEAEKK